MKARYDSAGSALSQRDLPAYQHHHTNVAPANWRAASAFLLLSSPET
jgi:hypothetical protein